MDGAKCEGGLLFGGGGVFVGSGEIVVTLVVFVVCVTRVGHGGGMASFSFFPPLPHPPFFV